jgi:hypothetical protein
MFPYVDIESGCKNLIVKKSGRFKLRVLSPSAFAVLGKIIAFVNMNGPLRFDTAPFPGVFPSNQRSQLEERAF